MYEKISFIIGFDLFDLLLSVCIGNSHACAGSRNLHGSEDDAGGTD